MSIAGFSLTYKKVLSGLGFYLLPATNNNIFYYLTPTLTVTSATTSGSDTACYQLIKSDKLVMCSGYKSYSLNDGATWILGEAGATPTGMAYGNGMYFASTPGSGDPNYTSNDGIDWTATSATTSRPDVAYGNGFFVSFLDQLSMQTSTDGINWTTRYTDVYNSDGYPYYFTVSYVGGRFFATGQNWAMLTSPNGTDWTKVLLDDTIAFSSRAIYDGTNYLIQTSDGRIIQSLNGTDWSFVPSMSATYGDVNSIYSNIAYGAGRYISIAFHSNGLPDNMVEFRTSLDLITWTSIVNPDPIVVDGFVIPNTYFYYNIMGNGVVFV